MPVHVTALSSEARSLLPIASFSRRYLLEHVLALQGICKSVRAECSPLPSLLSGNRAIPGTAMAGGDGHPLSLEDIRALCSMDSLHQADLRPQAWSGQQSFKPVSHFIKRPLQLTA